MPHLDLGQNRYLPKLNKVGQNEIHNQKALCCRSSFILAFSAKMGQTFNFIKNPFYHSADRRVWRCCHRKPIKNKFVTRCNWWNAGWRGQQIFIDFYSKTLLKNFSKLLTNMIEQDVSVDLSIVINAAWD